MSGSYPPSARPAPNHGRWRSAVSGALPLRMALLLFAVVLILFGWLHFVLALEISATGHQIQDKTHELAKLQRDVAALERSIALESSPSVMESRALQAKYRVQQAIYVMLAQPLGRKAGERSGAEQAP
jgi:cell division protein FtsB